MPQSLYYLPTHHLRHSHLCFTPPSPHAHSRFRSLTSLAFYDDFPSRSDSSTRDTFLHFTKPLLILSLSRSPPANFAFACNDTLYPFRLGVLLCACVFWSLETYHYPHLPSILYVGTALVSRHSCSMPLLLLGTCMYN